MIANLLFTKSMGLLEKGLDASSKRNNVLANNLANVDTPGFKRSEVVFEYELQKALQQNGISGVMTHEKHIPIGRRSVNEITPEVVLDKSTTMRNDGNNVDIDREMAALAKNTIMYTTLAQEINGEFKKLMTAITEGRR